MYSYRTLHSSLLIKIRPRILQSKKKKKKRNKQQQLKEKGDNNSMKKVKVGLSHLCLCLLSTVLD